ncbi:ABC-type dipeptide/oligopeptide/nickel transport system permease subunit [Symbiobacterium terraclitae]|uniref:ABC-type dipeptide/oligopeptide/nickel transport system permease subunit n=1 Tax=Symbiobacterium terraclitae TaxID=557451 RepID=A0ABS4JP70_9FIRM|nr:hypothetical protein [Symbiobacterium terraclitae]MBP2017317.1 ABC-type dipeptide/oligopeptide/nickel transport system permease subunit [Symbiobacterium terraclitae]
MRSTYAERFSRFCLGLLAAALLLWLLRVGVPGDLPAGGVSLKTGQPVLVVLRPALAATLGNAAAAVLYALPAALLLGVPAGLRPESPVDRVLQAPAVALMGVPAYAAGILGVWLVMSGPLGGVSLSAAANGALTVVLVGWLARAVRDGLAGAREDGLPLSPARALAAVLGRILQQTGNILVLTMAAWFVARGPGAGLLGQVAGASANRDFPVLQAGLWALVGCGLAGHLAGDLLVTAAGTRRAAGRPSRGWLAVGVLLVLVLFAAALPGGAPGVAPANLQARLLPPGSEGLVLGTDQLGRDLLSRIGEAARTSLAVAGGALAVAALGGAVVAGIGLAAGKRGRTLLAPRVAVPGLLGPLLAGMTLPGLLTGALTPRSSIFAFMLALGLASVPAAAWAFRRFGAAPRQQWPALLGLLTLTLAQILLTEFTLSFLGFGLGAPLESLGRLAGDALPLIRTAPHLLWGVLPGAAGLIGLFLTGHALLDAAPDEE